MSKTRFHSILEAKINEAVDNRALSIANGACSTYDHYRENVGFIQGLREALKLCEEIQAESE